MYNMQNICMKMIGYSHRPGRRTERQIGVCKDKLSLRASAHTGVAIPRLKGIR